MSAGHTLQSLTDINLDLASVLKASYEWLSNGRHGRAPLIQCYPLRFDCPEIYFPHGYCDAQNIAAELQQIYRAEGWDDTESHSVHIILVQYVAKQLELAIGEGRWDDAIRWLRPGTSVISMYYVWKYYRHPQLQNTLRGVCADILRRTYMEIGYRLAQDHFFVALPELKYLRKKAFTPMRNVEATSFSLAALRDTGYVIDERGNTEGTPLQFWERYVMPRLEEKKDGMSTEDYDLFMEYYKWLDLATERQGYIPWLHGHIIHRGRAGRDLGISSLSPELLDLILRNEQRRAVPGDWYRQLPSSNKARREGMEEDASSL